jgi:lipopolysaccharide transport system permease protein
VSVAVPSIVPADAPEVVIRPPGRWSGFGFAELWHHRELLYFITKRELQIRYKQSLFGAAWAILQPLAYALVFTLIFSRVAHLSSQGVPYTVFALAALVPWGFASQGVTQSASSLVGDANLLTKVYFPRLVVPAGKVLSLVVDLVIALCVLGVFVVGYGVRPSAGLVLLPGFLLLAAVTAGALGALLGALNVKYRDVAVGVPLLVQLWLFATPVIYPGTYIKGAWHDVYAINPMVSVIEGVRWGFLSTPAPDGLSVAISVASALVLLVAGLVYFRRTERFFADVI